MKFAWRQLGAIFITRSLAWPDTFTIGVCGGWRDDARDGEIPWRWHWAMNVRPLLRLIRATYSDIATSWTGRTHAIIGAEWFGRRRIWG
jgi:hypothetical protein